MIADPKDIDVTWLHQKIRALEAEVIHLWDLKEEVARLREINLDLAERVARQAELLGRRAERPCPFNPDEEEGE